MKKSLLLLFSLLCCHLAPAQGQVDTEEDYRQKQILLFCELLSNAYQVMDLEMIKDVYKDAVFISTSVRRKVSSENADTLYEQQRIDLTAAEYFQKLERIINRQKSLQGGYIHVDLSDISIQRHPAKSNYYGVSMRQKWSTKGYKDEGFVFLIWDFNINGHPKIILHAWQPALIKPEERWSLKDFKIY